MREIKKHWNDGTRPRLKGMMLVKQRSLCGREFVFGGFANAKRKVTCLTCKRLIAGYQGEKHG